MNVELLDKAVASALCPMFQAIVPYTNTIAVAGLVASAVPPAAPIGLKVAYTAAAVSGLSQLGASMTCPETFIGPSPPPGRNNPVRGCIELANGNGDLFVQNGTTINDLVFNDIVGYRVAPYTAPEGEERTTGAMYTLWIRRYQGMELEEWRNPIYLPNDSWFFLRPEPGAQCADEAPPEVPDNPEVPPHTYVDESTNCTYTVNFEGFIRDDEQGPISPVFRIESAAEERSGGRMGGCNLGPVIYAPGPNGPGGPGGRRYPPIPVPEDEPEDGDDGVPWWAPPLLGGAAGAVLNQILDAVQEPTYEAGTFTLTAPCDYTEEGDNVSYFFPFPKGGFQQRVLDHQMAILDVLQYHLNSRTPICEPERPQLAGQWVTTRWESVEKMAHSGRRLRKLFRYRTQSSRSLGQLSDYWKGFSWEAGAVCVRHTGAWWGDPQVWASTEEEGKRVIRHAAAEAGLDPDQVGQWAVSSSRSPRYGMSGTMTIQTFEGFPWVAKRDGSDWPNTLALSSDP